MSRVDPPGPEVTRFPWVTSARPVRPATGERTLVYPRSSWAARHGRFRRSHLGARLGDQREPGIHLFLGDGLRRDQALGPLDVALVQLQHGLGPG